MNKLKLLLIVITSLLLISCASVPQEGNFNASGHYKQNADGSYDLSHVQITLIPIGITPTSPIPPGSPTPTVIVPTVTNVPSATSTVVPTATKTPTIVPTVTATPIITGQNLFLDADFEGPAEIYTWPSGLRLPEVAVSSLHDTHGNPVYVWHPFFCDFPYKSRACPAPFQGTKNPSNLLMGRYEARSTTITNRVHSGNSAQYWFCQFRSCDGGVYQTIKTTSGQTCTSSAYIQSWSRVAWDNTLPSDQNFKSGFPNDDAYSNSLWRIVVDPYGGTNIDASFAVKSSWYSIPKSITNINGEAIELLDHYDKYAKISYTFTAKGAYATIYFENLRLFPFTFNDSMIDDASVICKGTETPTPLPTVPGVTPTPQPTYVGAYPSFMAADELYVFVRDTYIYLARDASITASRIPVYKDQEIPVKCIVEDKPREYWGSKSECAEAKQWFIIRLGENDYAVKVLGGEG